MISKVTALAVLSALAEQATAAAHIQHRHLHERDLIVETDTTTVWETVTVYIGADGKPTPAADSGNGGNDEVVNNPAVATTTSSTSVVVQETPEVNIPDQPKATTTTTAQQQPSSEAEKPSSVVEKPSSVSSAAPVSSSPSNGGNDGGVSPAVSGKRGIGYNEAGLANAVKGACGSNCGWTYNWEPQPKDESGLLSDLLYIPQMKQPRASGDALWPEWWAEYKSQYADKAKILFSFNEPDRPDQADTLPAQAAIDHATYFKEYIGKASISSPAVSSDVIEGKGLDYLEKFHAACAAESGCHYDFCNVHWYGTDENLLYDFIDQAYELCSKNGKGPIWITELGFPDEGSWSAEEAAAFINKISPKLESNSKVGAWAWFFASNTKPWYLSASENALTSAGTAYAS